MHSKGKSPASLCLICHYVKRIRTRKSSTFYLCGLHSKDPRFVKYPHQPVLSCKGYTPASPDADAESS